MKKFLSAHFVLFLVSMMALAPQAHSASEQQCTDFFFSDKQERTFVNRAQESNLELINKLREIKRAKPQARAEVNDYLKSIRQEVFENSKKLTVKVSSESKLKRSYDVVIVGAGPHGAVVASEILKVNPMANILILDNSTGELGAGVFSNLGESFRINSAESREISGNNFPGNPVQVSDFNSDGIKYVSSQVLGHLTTTVQ